jgi:hypothetical protein
VSVEIERLPTIPWDDVRRAASVDTETGRMRAVTIVDRNFAVVVIDDADLEPDATMRAGTPVLVGDQDGEWTLGTARHMPGGRTIVQLVPEIAERR